MGSAVLTPILGFQTERQKRLAVLNEARLRPCTKEALSPAAELELRQLESSFLQSEGSAVATRLTETPSEPAHFLQWFEDLRETGPGQNDPLFPWLAHEASLEQMTWFLAQEVAGEAGFDDLVAMTQLKMPTRPKLEMARNYWDEMGHGKETGMHGGMLDLLADELHIRERNLPTVWESTALGNLLIGLAFNRHYAYQSIGALGVVELTAPGRAALVAEGLERLGIAPTARRYYALHATLDVRHSAAWNAEVIEPIVTSDPSLALPIAEGALMRLHAGQRCFERYRRELGLPEE